jgi:Transglycosylase-like domain
MALAYAVKARFLAAVASAPRPGFAPDTYRSTGDGGGAGLNSANWECIRNAESGGSGGYAAAGGGAYQFEDGTWTSVTGLPGPAEAYSSGRQDAAALALYDARGWEPWSADYGKCPGIS